MLVDIEIKNREQVKDAIFNSNTYNFSEKQNSSDYTEKELIEGFEMLIDAHHLKKEHFKNPETGIYISKGVIRDYLKEVLKLNIKEIYIFDDYKSAFGVCDHYKQIFKHYPEIKKDDNKYIIGLTPFCKENQPEGSGWRWRKWGPYIGDKQPTSEYLSDEPKIDKVYTYRIYQIFDQ